MSNVFRCKAVVLGDVAVGKSSILNSLLGYPKPFSKRYLMTRGVEIVSKSLKVAEYRDDIVEIYFYDFSGRESLYGDLMRRIWDKNVSIVVGVFDLTKEESFHQLQTLISEFMKQALSRKEPVVGIILGNKCDRTEHRLVMADDAMQWAKKLRMRYFDCSAKDHLGIDEAFHHLARAWFEKHKA